MDSKTKKRVILFVCVTILFIYFYDIGFYAKTFFGGNDKIYMLEEQQYKINWAVKGWHILLVVCIVSAIIIFVMTKGNKFMSSSSYRQ